MHNKLFISGMAVVLAAMFFYARPAASQVNTEKLRAWDDSAGISGALGFALTLKSGNTEFLDYGVTGRTDMVGSWYRFFLLAEYHLLRKDGEDFSRRGFVHVRLNIPVNSWLTWEVFGQEENNRSTRLDQRWLAGTGIRVKGLNTDVLKAYIGTAYMYEYEKLSEWTPGVDDPEVNVHRWSNYLVLRLELGEHAAFQNTAYIQPRFDAFDDYRILEEAALIVRLWDHIALRNELVYRYDSLPPDGIEEYDLTFNVGFTLSF